MSPTPATHSATASLTAALLSDAALIARIRAGEGQHFQTLLDRYQPQARAIAGRILKRDGAGLEDVLAEAALRAWSHLDRLREQASFRSWYCTIVRNAALDFAQRSQRERGPQVETVLLDEEPAPWWLALPSDAPNPAEAFQSAEDARALRQALTLLDPLYRDPLEARYFGDLPYEAIAHELDKPVGTIKSLVHRGKAQLAFSLCGATAA